MLIITSHYSPISPKNCIQKIVYLFLAVHNIDPNLEKIKNKKINLGKKFKKVFFGKDKKKLEKILPFRLTASNILQRRQHSFLIFTGLARLNHYCTGPGTGTGTVYIAVCIMSS